MKIKKLIKILKQYNKNRKVRIHTSSCIEDILNVDQSYDADYDEVYLVGDLDYDVGLQHSVSQTNQILKLEQEVARLKRDNDKFYGKYDEGLQVSVSQTNQIMKLEQEVSRLRARNMYLQERVEELTPKKATPKYDFSEVPNDSEGQEFVDNVKKYLNMGKYNMRVRGQHIKEELKGKGLTSYGQNIDESTHLRVYIEEK